jgi:putative SOS response-associated peptidase YedK
MINARAETVSLKDSFRDAFRRRRCLVIADGFYEWQKAGGTKQPIFIRLRDGRAFGFAGLYESWTSPEGQVVRTCTIITTEANEVMRPIHDRMPVILPRQDEDAWLDPNLADPNVLLDLLKPYPSEDMVAYPVSRMVNSSSNDSIDCVKPIDDTAVPESIEAEQLEFLFED